MRESLKANRPWLPLPWPMKKSNGDGDAGGSNCGCCCSRRKEEAAVAGRSSRFGHGSQQLQRRGGEPRATAVGGGRSTVSGGRQWPEAGTTTSGGLDGEGRPRPCVVASCPDA